MNLDTPFPEITATLNRPHTPLPGLPLAPVAATAIDLEKINLTDLALSKFGDWRGAVAAVTANLSTLALDLSTQARVNDAKSLRERTINVPRSEARKISKALRSKFAATGKDVAAAEEQIVEAWDKAEKLITPKIEAAQQTLDAEKAERQRIEREAAEAHAARLAAIATFAERSREPGMTAERIGKGMQILTETDLADEDKARAVELADAQCRALEVMRTLHAQATAREAEAARQEAIRAENERRAAELAEAERRLAAEAAEIRRQAAALEAARAAEVVRENQRKAAEEAAARAESDRLEALAVANREHLAREAEELARARATLTVGNPADAVVTGTQGHMLQDCDRGLSMALAGKPDAMQHAREAAEAIRPDDPDAAPPMTAEEMGAEKPEQMDDAALTPALRPDGTPKPVITVDLDDTPPAPLPSQPEPATVKLGQLQTDIPPLTEAFITQLGFTATKDGRATLYTATQRTEILRAYVAYIQERI